MKTFDAATIGDMAEDYASQTVFAAMAALCIRFITAYLAASVWFQTISIMPFFACTYARKRIVNRITHQRKFALFQRCGRQGIYN
ncbi:hypothetical protein SAMN05216464_11134 [Mucilaginibacter pineti]|uniref:Uncharacterized protein n=1 Tax=Mucilaginibacter pineti TaxID=1391627 RepID=A0A1G7H3L5_9SPHI|nr:hypothetical protein SAMN05216464_11134 [Mucilaginibacter pineti]